jgi:hypothetical protein
MRATVRLSVLQIAVDLHGTGGEPSAFVNVADRSYDPRRRKSGRSGRPEMVT